MPDFASALKEEIRRLARKESKRCLALVVASLTKQRKELTALRKQLAALERAVRAIAADPPGDPPAGRALPGDGLATDGRRFSPKGMRSHRRRLDLSADDFGRLLGVSAQSVYAWEAGRARPRVKPLAALVELRHMGKREIMERLEQLKAAAPASDPSSDGQG